MDTQQHVIGIFGGSFNPPHDGHVAACHYLVAQDAVDAILVVPCWVHPYQKALALFEDRVAMCHLAFDRIERVTISEVERELGGVSHTIETVRHLRAQNGSARFCVIVGEDLLQGLTSPPPVAKPLEPPPQHRRCGCGRRRPRLQAWRAAKRGVQWNHALARGDPLAETSGWKEIDALRAVAPFVILPRGGHGPIPDVSATEVRRRVAAGESIAGHVPPLVADYIAQHRLYKKGSDPSGA